jgi:hypothetical protein
MIENRGANADSKQRAFSAVERETRAADTLNFGQKVVRLCNGVGCDAFKVVLSNKLFHHVLRREGQDSFPEGAGVRRN